MSNLFWPLLPPTPIVTASVGYPETFTNVTSYTMSLAVTSGELVLLFNATYIGANISSVTDSQSNSWSQITSQTQTDSSSDLLAGQIWQATAGSTGTLTVTINLNIADRPMAEIIAISGQASTPFGSSPIVNSNNSGNIVTSGLTSAGGLVIASMYTWQYATVDPASPWTNYSAASLASTTQWQCVSTTPGTVGQIYSTGWTIYSTGYAWITVMIEVL